MSFEFAIISAIDKILRVRFERNETFTILESGYLIFGPRVVYSTFCSYRRTLLLTYKVRKNTSSTFSIWLSKEYQGVIALKRFTYEYNVLTSVAIQYYKLSAQQHYFLPLNKIHFQLLRASKAALGRTRLECELKIPNNHYINVLHIVCHRSQ